MTRPAHKKLSSPLSAEPHLSPAAPVKKVPASALTPQAGPGLGKSKVGVWADEDVIERIRAAWFHTPTTSPERERSFSDFLLQAALTRTKSREKKFNGGEEFPKVPAGKIGSGRKS